MQTSPKTSSPAVIDDTAQDILFRTARTYNGWLDGDVEEELLHRIYDLMKMGPTSANCCPLRIVFVKSPEAKEKLKPALMDGNVEKTMAAPVTAIMVNDLEFYEHLPFLFPHADAKSWFTGEGKDTYIKETAMRNASLQAGYFMLAARGLGLDCGPMSGFNPKKVKEAFFEGQNVEVNMLCNLGYGDPESIYPRGPRLDFGQVCETI